MKEKYLSNENPNRGLRRETKVIEEAAEEPVVQAIKETPKKKSKVGIVVNCEKLNLRNEPKKDLTGNNVITELLAGSAVVIDDDEVEGEFYKVTTEAGLEGYCMKEYIRLT